MIGLGTLVLSLGALVFGCVLSYVARRIQAWRRRKGAETFSDPGYSVEVDCRECGQFNRVLAHRLRDRPKCGRCKLRLMPGRRVFLCRVSPMEGLLSTELNAVWTDEDRLWQCLADHITLKVKERAEANEPHLRVVN